jgi:hypothetical protein
MNKINIDEIKLSLDIYGFYVMPSFYKNHDFFKDIKLAMSNTVVDNSESNKEYKGGNCKIFKLSKNKSKEDLIYYKFVEQIKKDFLNNETFKNYSYNLMVRSLDTPKSKHIAQDPHFDRINTLKFMLYINDLKHENGAFCLSSSSNNWVRNEFSDLRPSHANKKYFAKTRGIPSLIINNLKPVEGNAGTLIIFNTDCVHHQGIVKKGSCKILRAHFKKENSILQKTINKLNLTF